MNFFELTERMRQEDERAFWSHIYRTYEPWLVERANSQLSGRATAIDPKEVVQNALIYFWKNADRLDHPRSESELAGVLWKKVNFMILDECRRLRNGVEQQSWSSDAEVDELADAVPDAGPSVHEVVASRMRARQAHSELKRILDPIDYGILCGRVEGRSFRTIAAELGIPSSTCHAKYRRAVRSGQEAIGHMFKDDEGNIVYLKVLDGECSFDPTGEKLAAYLDFSLSPDEDDELERHIGQCRCCKDEVDRIKQLRDVLNPVEDYYQPDGLEAAQDCPVTYELRDSWLAESVDRLFRARMALGVYADPGSPLVLNEPDLPPESWSTY